MVRLRVESRINPNHNHNDNNNHNHNPDLNHDPNPVQSKLPGTGEQFASSRRICTNSGELHLRSPVLAKCSPSVRYSSRERIVDELSANLGGVHRERSFTDYTAPVIKSRIGDVWANY
jgi:hypothetical protein